MKYFDEDKLCSVNEFYENAKKQKRELRKNSNITDEELEEKKALLLGAQFVSKKYIELMQESPDEYPEISPVDIMGEMKYIDAVHEYMISNGDGEDILDSYPIVSAAMLVKKTHIAINNKGIDNCVTERIVHSVVSAIEAVSLKAIRQAPQYNISASNVINAPQILKRYPEIVKVMTDEATREIFTNNAERNQWSQFVVYENNAKDNASLLLSQSVSADPNNKVLIESEFTIYDWCVMEAVATLYSYAEKENKLDNGAVSIDIQSIDKILKRDISSRMSSETKRNIFSSDIVKSLVKLMGNHVQIVDPVGNYEGDLVDAELSFVANKLCLIVKSKPILFEYADTNGRNHIESVPIDDLKLELTQIGATYSTEMIAIYRFLLGRLREIYGSYIIDGKHNKPKQNYSNSVPLQSIIDAIYPEGLGKYKDAGSKSRFILKNTRSICKAMKLNGNFFKNFTEGSNSNGDITFSFER